AEVSPTYRAHESGDSDRYELVAASQSYRPFIGGKLRAMLAGDPPADVEARERGAWKARRFFLLALSAARAPLRRPVLVAVGGVIASGKSTIAAALGREMAAGGLGALRARNRMARVVPPPPARG